MVVLTKGRARVASAAALVVVALAAIVFFDLQTTLALNDDYIYSWSARHLAGGVLYPRQTALALPQIVAGWLVSLPFAHDQRVLRLSVMFAVASSAWAAFRIARRLGAGTMWAVLAAAVIVTSPIFFNLAVSFMSDVAFVGLLLLACDAAVDWLDGGRGRGGFALWATLATLQRVVGIGIAPCLAIALLVRWRRSDGGIARSDFAWLAVAFVGSVAAAIAPGPLGVSGGFDVVDRIRHFDATALLTPLIHLPVIAGYLLLPLALALGVRWGAGLIAFAVASAALLVVLLIAFTWLPGNIWTFVGPVPTLQGFKEPPVQPFAVAAAIALSAMAFWLLFGAGAGRWIAASADPKYAFLLLTSGVQLALLLPNTVSFYDRYYLPVVAPLVPMLAALAQRFGRPGAAPFAWAACALMLVAAAVYQQDYQAWQVARDRAATMAYQCAPPAEVNAGYEANAVYVEIPTYEATGRAAPARTVGRDVTLYGPAHPVIWLAFASPDDSRPGVPYFSVASGKIVFNGALCAALTGNGTG